MRGQAADFLTTPFAWAGIGMGQLPSKPEPNGACGMSLAPLIVLRHLDPRTGTTVEQPLEVILGERVSRPLSDQGGEGGKRAGIARF